MIACETVRNRLNCVYGETILCRIGVGETTTYNTSKGQNEQANMAVYIHEKYRIAIVWNLESRRVNNRMITSFSLSQGWNEIKPEAGEIKAIYKKMGTDRDAPFEKVLVLDVDTLDSIAEELNLFLKINPEDNECPNEIRKGSTKEYDIPSVELRSKVSTYRWERDRRFRKTVLDAYGCKCAICRCDVEELLEAAHIVSVSNGGNDNPKNGICLCANHHIMYDKELIKINFKKHILIHIDESVKTMPWYFVFQENHDGKLLLPQYKVGHDKCELECTYNVCE